MRKLLTLLMAVTMSGQATAADWTLVIHGGAGVIERSAMTPERDRETRAALTRALQVSGAILDRGGSSLDAVEAAVKVLEDDPHFNAGRGAVFTYEGRNELDAAIMEGKTRKAGAVAGVTTTKNPISLARAVMEKSQHVMLAGSGATEFAREQGIEQVDPSYFRTEERYQQLQTLRSQGANYFDVDMKYGTVGAVARDKAGNLAAATSTGGVTGKRWGRIGDAPIIGAGTYADNRACAVSATGSGEFYIREGVAHEICARMRFLNEGPKAAADKVQAETQSLGGSGGVIVVAADGTPAWSFNTPGMYRGRVQAGGKPVVGVYGDEE
jgi:beta-aspartyl-peptidase (threonine type)